MKGYLPAAAFAAAFIMLSLGAARFLESPGQKIDVTRATPAPSASPSSAPTSTASASPTPSSSPSPSPTTTPTGSPTITVENPNGGERIPLGPRNFVVRYRMTEFTQLAAPSVIMEVARNGRVLGNIPFSEFQRDPTYWNFSWNMSYHARNGGWTKAEAGSGYKVRMVLYDGATKVAEDESDTPFTIVPETPRERPVLQVLSPNGGEVWQQGDVRTIHVSISGESSVSIELRKGGRLISSFGAALDSDNASVYIFEWPVPQDLADGSDYTIRAVESGNSSNYDESDAPFTITRMAL